MSDFCNSPEFTELVLRTVHGDADPACCRQLEEVLRTDSEAARRYVELLELYMELSPQGSVDVSLIPESRQYDDLLRSMSEYEKTAPALEILQKEPPRELIRKIEPQKMNVQINRGSFVTLLMSAAALLLMVLFVRLAPKTGLEVATLTDSINAEWVDAGGAMEKGARIVTGHSPILLRKGLAQVQFDTNARLVIEAPAEFQIVAEDQIKLNYGRLYATVPHEAIGFTVNTSSARIIDLGTEFGVSVDTSGDMELHVLRGRTMLIGGGKFAKVSMEVGEGYAKKISGATQEVSDIPCQKELFVRAIDSKEKLVWKGQNQISLADIVGGGNGLGTGQVNTGVDPATGQKAKSVFKDNNITNAYHPVPSNSFIDGVFVPNGRTEQVVSSMRHVFQECPVTSGIFYTGIINTPVTAGKEWVLAGLKSNHELMAEVKPDSMETYPCILMHANLGITFDLQAIRSMLPNSKITCFRSPFGLAPLPDSMFFNADFWVLVDGKLKYKRTQVNERGKAGLIDIELSDTDRFLTLVITDGEDPKEGTVRIQTPIYGDWCVFMEPILVLE